MEFKYPRVSEILSPYSSIGLANVPADALEHAASRGTILHQYCVAYARGDFVPSINEEFAPYFDHFKKWYDENVEELIFSETRLFEHALKYCGKPDLIVKIKETGALVLLDIKTSSQIYRTYPVQLSAYWQLCNANELKVDSTCILHIPKTLKNPNARTYNPHVYLPLFKYARSLYTELIEERPKKKATKKEEKNVELS